MRRLLGAAAGLAISAALSAGHAQTVYPIDRADILVGARFDFKAEFPGLVDPAKVSVTLNGEDHAKIFGKAADFVEREDGKDQSALILRDVSLARPGTYKVKVTDATQTRELECNVFQTGPPPPAGEAPRPRPANTARSCGRSFPAKPDVRRGGGRATFLPKSAEGSKRKDDSNSVAQFRDAGYAPAPPGPEMAAAAGNPATG